MATSGSIDYTVTRDDIITEAMEIMGVLEAGDSPSTDDTTSLSRTLNMMVKAIQADCKNLFAVQKMYVFMQQDQHEYDLGTSSTDHYTTSFVQTALNGALAASDTAVVVDSITGISDGDYIGIVLDDGSMHWDTVNGAPSGSTITITTGVASAASDDAVVYAYTTKANRPMKILNQLLRDSDKNDTPLFKLTRDEYVYLPNKTYDGPINTIYYDPQVGTATLSVWPETDDVSKYLVLWVMRTLEDFDASTDNPDFPQEWYLALAWSLANFSKTEYGVPIQMASTIRTTAAGLLEDAKSFDVEDYIIIQPDTRGAS